MATAKQKQSTAVKKEMKQMPELNVYNQDGKEVGKVQLKKLWNGEVHRHVLHLALRQELANRRTGTHSTKTRAEVSGSGRKPWKQKGTGRARAGSIRSPLWRHGGVIFGPHPRSHAFSLPRQVRQLAFKSAFLNLIEDGKLMVLDKLDIPDAKTKHLAQVLKNFKTNKALVLFSKTSEKLQRAGQNLSLSKFLPISQLNVHDLLRYKKIFLTKETLNALEEVLS